jgi:hypothetical protein
MSTDLKANRALGFDQRTVVIAVVLAIAFKLALLFVFAWHIRFVMDEFGQLGYAKYLGNGLFRTVWPAKAVGSTSFFGFAHLIGRDATSILLIGRLQTALLGCGTIAMVYGCARLLGENRLRALLVVLVLLSFSNFLERIFRTNAEPVALFFAAAALLVILRARADRARTLVAAGVLSGLSFLATQKAVYFNVALGVALLADAAFARRYLDGIKRGSWLVLGWLVSIVVYCLIFGGTSPLPIARSLVFGPTALLSPQIAAEYGGLGYFVGQTLSRNALLYAFCFAGMMLELLRIPRLDERRRIALVFSIVITVLVFAHDQPWPYVFIMALPFMSLWAPAPFDRLSDRRLVLFASALLAVAIATSFVRNVWYLRFGNADQLELVARAESLLAPGERYFDGVGMLPNRPEPSTLWLDRHYVLKTLREKQNSEAYGIFANHPPKLILWSYRMDAIDPVVAPLIGNSYAQVAPNIRMAGRRLDADKPILFNVPIAGRYRLYSEAGGTLQGSVDIDGVTLVPPTVLGRGPKSVTLRSGPRAALLLPEGAYAGRLNPGADDPALFDGVYN